MARLYKPLITALLFLFVCLPLLATSRFLLLNDPPVWPDEPVFVSIAQNFASSYELKTDIHGILGSNLNNIVYGYPPFYFYALGIWVKLFGSTIESIRLFPLITSLMTLATFFLLVKKVTNDRLLSLFAVLLLTLNPQFAQSSRIARMEILVILFTLLSLLFTIIAQNKKNHTLYLLSGILCALSTLTHPIGIITPGINFLFIAFSPGTFKTKFKHLFLIISPVLLGLLLWLVSIQSHFTPFLSDLQKHLTRKNSLEPYLLTMIQKDPLFRAMFLPQVISVIGLIIFFFRRRKSQTPFLPQGPLLAAMGSIVSLSLIIYGKEMWYLVYFAPFATLTIILLLAKILILKNRLYALILIVLLNIPFIVNLYQLQNNFTNNFYRDYNIFSSQVLDLVKSHSPICISSIPDPYFTLIKDPNLKLYEFIYLDFETEKRKEFLDSCNSMVINHPGDRYSMEYIDRNISQYMQIRDVANYSTYIIILKDKNHRN